MATPVLSIDSPSGVVVQASVIRRRLGVLVDRLSAAGGFEPTLLAELEAFVHDQALPAARAYEAVLEDRWQAEAVRPENRACPHACWKSDFTCPRDQAFEQLLAELEEAGYHPHHNAVDAEVTASFPCVCGGRLEYVGRRTDGSYRAFGVCRSCGHWIEF